MLLPGLTKLHTSLRNDSSSLSPVPAVCVSLLCIRVCSFYLFLLVLLLACDQNAATSQLLCRLAMPEEAHSF
jgi:hypothetical protein